MSSSYPPPDRVRAFVDRLYRSLDALYHGPHAANPHAPLISRLAEGLTIEQIARETKVEVEEVQVLLTKARTDFGAKTNEELVAVAVRDGLVEIP